MAMMTNRATILALLILLGPAMLAVPSTAAELVSVNDAGTDTANGDAISSGFPPDLSADGRFVAFSSDATDLVLTLDTNAVSDVFVRDRLLGTTELISINVAGTDTGASFSNNPTISDDGRFVVFTSEAPDLVATDTNGAGDVFVHDRVSGTTTLVSINASGGDSGNGTSRLGIVSPNGASVVFVSVAGDLVATDSNGADDVFVRDLVAGATVLASINVTGTDSGAGGSGVFSQVPSISADGRRVAYPSDATDLIASDMNGLADIFVYDLATGSNVLASPALGGTATANGTSSVPAISADGRFVAFASAADNLVTTDTNTATDFFVYDVATGTTELASTTTGGTDSVAGGVITVGPASISADGNLVAFTSFSDGFVASDTNGTGDVFVRDRSANETTLISATPSGTSGDRESLVLAAFSTPFSTDGRFVVFISNAMNLAIQADANNAGDVFVRDRHNGTTSLLSVSVTGTAGAGTSFIPTIGADGSSVAFLSNATDLVPVDTNGLTDVFASDPPILLFADGFESGDTAAWTATVR